MLTGSVVTHEQQEARDYLDRVALEAMKVILDGARWGDGESERMNAVLETVADASYQLARNMLKARSQGGAE